MKVLLLGATGNVGSRVLSALLAHSHTPILYVRNASKLPQQVLTSLPSSNIITGDAADTKAIQKAIEEHDCEAVISAAGQAGILSRTEAFPKIFRAVIEATAAAAKAKGQPIRCWMLGGLAMLDIPLAANRTRLVDYIPLFPDHKENFALLETIPVSEVAWSMLCPSQLVPSKHADATIKTKAASEKILAAADVPPAWASTLHWVPLVGGFLNIMANAASYTATLEEAAEVMVRDLSKGTGSEFVGRRVGIKAVA